MNICICLEQCLSKFRNKKPAQKPRESQEESLFAHAPEEHILSDQIVTKAAKKKVDEKEWSKQNSIPSYFQEEEKENNDQADLLNIKLQLQTSNPVEKQTKIEQARDIQDLIKEELEITPLEAIKTVEIEPEFRQQILQENHQQLSRHTFSINLDPLDPYFALIHEKTNKIEQYFSKKGNKIELTAPNNIGLEVESVQSQNLSTLIIRYRLKCEYSFYLSTIKSDKLQHSFSNIIADVRVLETLKPNLTRNNINFKRIGSFEARGCSYVKYQNGSKRDHWQIYLHDDKQGPTADIKQCELFCVKQIREKSHRELEIDEYVQVDLKSINAGVMIGKLVTQYKSYLNSLQKYLQANYTQELV